MVSIIKGGEDIQTCFEPGIISSEEEAQFVQSIYDLAKRRYDVLSEEDEFRLNQELYATMSGGFAHIFELYQSLISTMKLEPMHYLIGGYGGNSLIAYLLGISWIDPLEFRLPVEHFYGIHGEKCPYFDIYVPDPEGVDSNPEPFMGVRVVPSRKLWRLIAYEKTVGVPMELLPFDEIGDIMVSVGCAEGRPGGSLLTKLIETGVIENYDTVPICREDVVKFCEDLNIDRMAAIEIADRLRRGRGLSAEDTKLFHEVDAPQWVYEYFRWIKYLPPRAWLAQKAMLMYWYRRYLDSLTS